MSNDFENRYSMTVSTEIKPIKTEPWMLDPSITYLNHVEVLGANVASDWNKFKIILMNILRVVIKFQLKIYLLF